MQSTGLVLFKCFKIKNFMKRVNFQLIYPSAIDPAGILMLRSVRIVFEMIGLKPESINFIKEEFNSNNLVKALTKKPKKCPAIVTLNILGDRSPHIMVATNAIKGIKFIPGNLVAAFNLRNQWFINCKNSYRDDIDEPGNVLLTFYAFKVNVRCLI